MINASNNYMSSYIMKPEKGFCYINNIRFEVFL